MALLHPCTETPSPDTPSGEACIGALASKYVFSGMLGSGEQGIVIEVIHKQHVMAVKIVPLDEFGIDEVQIQCMLNALQKKTGIFSRAYGWQVCNEIPRQWKEHVVAPFEESGPLLFIFMEKTIKAWNDVHLKASEYKAVLFLLLHGLYIARKELGFDHDDINTANVMLQPKEMGHSVNVAVGNVYFTVNNGRFVPKLIDYGMATTKYTHEEEEEDNDSDDLFGGGPTPSTDVSSLEYLLEDKIQLAPFFNSFEFMEAKESSKHDYKAIETLLLMDFFKEYRTDKENVQFRCSVCLTDAKLQWENGFTFCSKECGVYWGQSIGNFIIK